MMTDDERRAAAIAELKQCHATGDTEAGHYNADMVLCKLLIALGYAEVVNEWDKVDKWYA